MRHFVWENETISQILPGRFVHMGPKVISTKFQIDCDKHETTGSNPSLLGLLYNNLFRVKYEMLNKTNVEPTARSSNIR